MAEQLIHPTAVIEEGAEIGSNVTIEAYAVIKKNVKIGDNVTIRSHAYIEGHTSIGAGTTIFPGASIGCPPQATRYRGEKTYIRIGKNCHIREFVTINSSIGEDAEVLVGDGCMIMAYCHLAHNSVLGDHVIMSNNAALAGHVTIGDYAIIGGKTPIHQFVRVGKYAMVGGFSRVGQDIPPYTIGGGIPYRYGGLNLVGLKRHGFHLETRRALSRAFRFVFRSGLKLNEALARIESELPQIPEIQHWLDFCYSTKRGLIGLGYRKEAEIDDEESLFLEEEIDEAREISSGAI